MHAVRTLRDLAHLCPLTLSSSRVELLVVGTRAVRYRVHTTPRAPPLDIVAGRSTQSATTLDGWES
jgi:hypothetical protein